MHAPTPTGIRGVFRKNSEGGGEEKVDGKAKGRLRANELKHEGGG